YQSLESFSDKSHFENSSSFYSQNKNKIIVRMKKGNWNLTKLISEMQLTNEGQRKWIHNETDLEDFISGLIIRKYILRKAESAQVDKLPGFKKNIEYNFNTFLIQQVERQFREKITISADSIKAYYNENRDRFAKEGEMRLSSILIDNKLKADSVFQFMNEGISFEKLAEEYSIQTNTAKNKGDMGYFRKSDLENLGKKVFGMNAGQWIGPINDDGKFLFLKCTAIKPSVQRNLSEVNGEIKETLITLNWYKSRASYVSSLQKEIHVQLFPEKLNTLNLLTKAYDR
ncbi:MAG: peptidylprolyl isomerase, partial [Ignavibacteria bacterium]|nr:peptidylprolyl isomerase [Ignavibacteria bacterium]